MKYIKPEIEINEILSEDILSDSPNAGWGDFIAGEGSGSLGFDENGDPIVSGDASDFIVP